MYKKFIRPLLFLFPPETVHRLTVAALRFAGFVPGGRILLRSVFARRSPQLSTEVFGLHFANPVGMAAGFDKEAGCWRELGALGFGFVETGTITPDPQPGNPPPRVFRLPADRAIINRMGIPGHGMERAAKRLKHRRRGLIVGANIGKNASTPNERAAGDYLRVFQRLYHCADYFVVNVSCPNVVNMTALQNRRQVSEIAAALAAHRNTQAVRRPVLLKISPDLNCGQIDDMIAVAEEYGLDGLVATNTTTSREGVASDHSKAGRGGLSGAPLTVRALETVLYIRSRTDLPVVGSGGIMAPRDALVMLEAGAALVQIYTGLIYEGPSFPGKICKYLCALK
ncbi:MAG: quinone-dependent dihydroorotate dehydrogenase [Rikenellaceae bacterium]|jgi:dihydroorotate dehydrogenase|nr:quinone-dependent dihydroorotate dehydrogenase [Rikenellaceae bacterium]